VLRSEKNAEAAQQTATSVDCQRQKVVRGEVWASLRMAKMGQPLAEKEKHHGSAQNEVWSRGEFSSPIVLQRAGFTSLYPASLTTLYPAPAAYTGDLSLSLGDRAGARRVVELRGVKAN